MTVSRVLVLMLLLVLAAAPSGCSDAGAPTDDPHMLDGSWQGTTETAAVVRLHLQYHDGGPGFYDLPGITYTGYFSDGQGNADSVYAQEYAMALGSTREFRPITLNLRPVITETHAYEYYVRGTPAGSAIVGWLMRRGGPHNTPQAYDSVRLTLTRY